MLFEKWTYRVLLTGNITFALLQTIGGNYLGALTNWGIAVALFSLQNSQRL